MTQSGRRLDTDCAADHTQWVPCDLGIPNIFPLDIMQLINLNDPDLVAGTLARHDQGLFFYLPDRPERPDWHLVVIQAGLWHLECAAPEVKQQIRVVWLISDNVQWDMFGIPRSHGSP